MYTDADVDRSIQSVADDFIAATRCTKKVSDAALTAGSASLPAFPTDFRPERLIRAYIGDYPALSQVDTEALREQRYACGSSGLPQLIAFDSYTTGEVWPTPTAAYVALKLMWLEPFTAWTPGGGDPGTLNLPDDYLRNILIYGATAQLQHNEPEHKYATVTWQKYTAWRDSLRGAGSLGVQVVQRRKEA